MDAILAEYDSLTPQLETFCDRLREVISDLLDARRITIHKLEHRVKGRDSLASKIARPDKNYERLQDITDVCGIRLITFLPNDVDEVANILEAEFESDAEHSVDKRVYDNPQEFGYTSLHYVISLNGRRAELAEYSSLKDLKAEVPPRYGARDRLRRFVT